MSRTSLTLTIVLLLSLVYIGLMLKTGMLIVGEYRLVKDARGKRLRIYKLERVVSLDEYVPEIIAALGACDKIRVMGVVGKPHIPCPVLTYRVEGNLMEEIVLPNTDIVILPESHPYVTLLESKGIKVFAVRDVKKLEDIYSNILLVGSLLGVEEKARRVVEFLRDLEKTVVSRLEGSKAKGLNVLIVNKVEGETRLLVDNKDLMHEVLKKIGCSVPEIAGKEINPKELKKLDISILVLLDNIELKLDKNNIIVLKPLKEFKPDGLRIFLFMMWLSKKLYPTLFEDMNLHDELRRFYLEVYGTRA